MSQFKNYNGYFSESEFESAIISMLKNNGWDNYSHGKDIKRETKKDVLIKEDFKSYLMAYDEMLDTDDILDPNCDPILRYKLLSKAAEFVFASTQMLKTTENAVSNQVSFKTYFLKTLRRMRAAYDVCQPSGVLSDVESSLAECLMTIAGFVRKMSGTVDIDTDSMNKTVSKMVFEALKYNQVESVLESGDEEDIFSPEYFEKLSDVKMPATKLELLIKMIKKEIKEYSKVNQLAAKSFKEMIEKTIEEYHERRKHLTAEEAGETQEKASEYIIKKLQNKLWISYRR